MSTQTVSQWGKRMVFQKFPSWVKRYGNAIVAYCRMGLQWEHKLEEWAWDQETGTFGL